MTAFASFCLAAVFTIIPLHLFYWWVVRPAMLGILRVRLWRLQADMSNTVLELAEDQAAERAVVQRLGQHCHRLLHHLDDLDVVDVGRAARANESVIVQIEADMEVAINGQSPCADFANAVNILVAATLINSPTFVPVFAGMYTAAIWLPKAREHVARFRQGALAAAWGATATPSAA